MQMTEIAVQEDNLRTARDAMTKEDNERQREEIQIRSRRRTPIHEERRFKVEMAKEIT